MTRAVSSLSMILVTAGCSLLLISMNAKASADKTNINTDHYTVLIDNNEPSSVATAPSPPQLRVDAASSAFVLTNSSVE